MRNKLPVYLFSTTVLLACLACSPFILDFTLVPRFIVLAVLLCAVFVTLLYNQPVMVRADLAVVSFLLFTLWVITSVGWSLVGSEAVYEAGRTVLAFLVYVMALAALRYFPVLFKDLMYYIACIFAITGIIFFIGQIVTAVPLSKDQLYNITGFNGHKNLFSSFLFINGFFLAHAIIGQANKGKKFTAMALLLFTAVILILLRSRAIIAAALCVAILSCVLFYIRSIRLKPSRQQVFAALAILILFVNVVFLYALPEILQRQRTGLYLIDSERWELWKKTYYLIHKFFLCGIGAGNWQVYYPDAALTGLFRAEDLNFTFQRPHNDLLWILSETGVIGFNLYLCFILSVFAGLAISYARAGVMDLKMPGLLMIFIAGFLTISFFDFPRERIEHLVLFSIIMAYGSDQAVRMYPFGAKNIHINKPILNAVLWILSFVVLTGLLRYKGEYFTRKMYEHARSMKAREVIHAGHLATSFAYKLDPTSVPIRWYTANAKVTEGKMDLAHTDFLTAYQLNPYNRNVLNDLASSFIYRGDTAAAIKYYLEACRISPRFDEPKLNLAAVYIGQGKLHEASACLAALYHSSERRTQYEKLIRIKSGL
jgi:O-antigen ligase